MKASGRKRGERASVVSEQGMETEGVRVRETSSGGGTGGMYSRTGKGGSAESSFSWSQDVRENRARRCLDKSV